MSDPLKQLLDKATAKTNDCSEAKYVASWVLDLLKEEPGNYDLVVASLETIIEWAQDLSRAAELSK